ncbi:hypothetical protein BDEG_26029 [Batrachochytrium dendrobatidis JEL423]|uniref:Uncharacterized protein n=2 Tax=Batrachochytrium dendrobatidis (strain JEL423) TaxID=403673 RepID=A0A177WRZ0_BATDL|nr:hypothetical protein BDEG_26029 [Batrachochytrium dendrobatidis JEL423]
MLYQQIYRRLPLKTGTRCILYKIESMIVRDFAFAATDARFNGKSSAASTDTKSKKNDALRQSNTADNESMSHGQDAMPSSDGVLQGDSDTHHMDDSDGEVDVAGQGWEWKWSFRTSTASHRNSNTFGSTGSQRNSALEKKGVDASIPTPVLLSLKLSDLDSILLPTLVHTLEKELGYIPDVTPTASTTQSSVHAQVVDTPVYRLKVHRMHAVFPFVKATEYEMSMESGDELIIISKHAGDVKPHTDDEYFTESLDAVIVKDTDTAIGKDTDAMETKDSNKKVISGRWTSIDELEDVDTLLGARSSSTSTTPSKYLTRENMTITYSPAVDELSLKVQEFLDYNRSYGAGWLTGLKLRVYGKWEDPTPAIESRKAIITIQLCGIGLVPGNYCEAS